MDYRTAFKVVQDASFEQHLYGKVKPFVPMYFGCFELYFFDLYYVEIKDKAGVIYMIYTEIQLELLKELKEYK